MRRVTIYDTRTREARLLVPIVPPKVGLFVCGLTPYDAAHIGHGRTFVVFDVVARALARWGYRVFHVQNVTNIDDRLIVRGAEAGVDPLRLAERHFLGYRIAMERLGVRSVNYYPFATDYVPEILGQIGELVRKGFAYAASGSVYYDVEKFPTYGALSGQRIEEAKSGTRIEAEPGKRAPEDFVLWKAARPGEPTWESPWGPGRPGWHIEDTAITNRLLGARYDIHGGGLDLKFPHHEAEIAQAEAATGESPLVNYWMHAGMVRIRGEKMSKSLGNIVPLTDAIRDLGPGALRFYYLNAHYRSPLDFAGPATFDEVREAYRRLAAPAERIARAESSAGDRTDGEDLSESVSAASAALVESLDATLAEDFQTREAIALLFGWGKVAQEHLGELETLSGSALSTLSAPYRWGSEVLGLFSEAAERAEASTLAPVVQAAIDARARAKERKEYAEGDRIRDALRAAGIVLEDEGPRTRWRIEREEAA